MVKRAILFINGELSELPWLSLSKQDLLIGVDAGAEKIAALGRQPDLIIGDFDSIPHLPKGIPVIRYPRDKDFTDSELAVNFCLDMGVEEIIMVGSLGRRLDHFLANIFLAAKVKLTIIEGKQTLHFVEKEISLSGKSGDLVSLISLADCVGVTTEGLQWKLKGESLALGASRGISNVMTGKTARVLLERGRLLVVYNQR